MVEHCHRIASHRERLEAVLRELDLDERAAKDELADLLGPGHDPDPPAAPAPSAPGDDREATGTISIWLLGGLRLVARGVVVIGSGAERSSPVLRFIAACGSPGVHKERLAAEFWPDADPKTARRNLHQAIYSIRRLLSRHGVEDELVFANDHYALGVEPGPWRDVDELIRLVDQARIARRDGDELTAIDAFRRADLLYGGAFLADHPFDEWAMAPRERYRTLHREAAAAVLSHGEEAGDPCSVLQVASRLLALDPCDEDACRYLMRAHGALRQPHLAVMAFHTLSEQLQQQQGVDPSAETAELLHALIR